MKAIYAALLALAVASESTAQTTTYDAFTGDIEVPCVHVRDGSQPASATAPYAVRLARPGGSSQYSVQQLIPTDFDTDCGGSFDPLTQLYTDIVNVGDTSFTVTMRRGSDDRFTPESLAPRGAAQTSLWVARNGSNVVYLAGTIHVLRNSDYPLPRAYDEAYARASSLWFEIDMDDPAEGGGRLSAEQMQQLVRDPEGRTLAQELSPATYRALGEYLQRTWNLPIESVNTWSAQMLVNAYSYGHLEMMHGVGANGVDRYLANRAIADNKPIAGLESAASQYRVMQSIDEGHEEELVSAFLQAVYSGGDIEGFDRLARLWRNGDTATMNREDLAPMRRDDFRDYQLIQANRNAAWIPQIEKLLQSAETEMVVVGVAHMVGSDGLVAQLRRRGYLVEKY